MLATQNQSFPRPSMTRHVSFAALSALLLTAYVPAFAADSGVETVVVTAARFPDPVGNAAFAVTTLGLEQLQSSDRLDDALEQVPGLSLFRRSSSINSNATTQGISL